VTLHFSSSKPNIAAVIPTMDAIDEVLTTQSLDKVHLDPAIRAALSLAKKTLNKYYNLTDDSEIYRMAMSAFFASY
jgi:hypothetical protein